MATRQLIMGFYGEGSTDERFLPRIISRTAERLLAPQEIEIAPLLILHVRGSGALTQPERILDVARQAAGFHILFVHADADGADWDRAKRERITPGFDLVRKQAGGICEHLVAVIPVQEVEAWMLADHETIRRVLNTSHSPDALGLPPHPSRIENIASPKEVLREAVRIAQTERPLRRRKRLADLQVSLADSLDLDRLATISAYQRFVQELTGTLQALHMLP
jgi:hypothetical protein